MPIFAAFYPLTPTSSLFLPPSHAHTRSPMLVMVLRTSSPSRPDWVMMGRPASPPSETDVTRGMFPAVSQDGGLLTEHVEAEVARCGLELCGAAEELVRDGT